MARLWEWVSRDWTLKLTAVGISLLLWAVVRSEELTTVTLHDVPVQVHVRDPNWELAGRPTPRRVSLQLTGPVRELLRLQVGGPRVLVPVEEVRDSVVVAVIRSAWVDLGADVSRTRVDDIVPTTVRLVLDPVASRDIPVSLPTRGTLPAGVRFTGPVEVEPGAIRVSGPRRRLARLDSVRLPPLDLVHLTDTTAIEMEIDTAGLAGLLVRPTSVRVRVPVAADSLAGAPGARPADAGSRSVDSAGHRRAEAHS